MTRSVKDLRELINISRLSFHGEAETDECYIKFDEQDRIIDFDQNPAKNLLLDQQDKLSTYSKSYGHIERPESNLRHGRFKPLPAINAKTKKCPGIITDKICVTNPRKPDLVKLAYQKSCHNILKHIDGAAVTSWLHRANESVQWLSKWVSTRESFVQFVNFWLNEMNQQKRIELIKMEVGIIVDEIEFAVREGLTCNKVARKDVMSFFLVIIWEYPSKICGPLSHVFLVNMLKIVASSQKHEYRKLLSNVKFTTKNAEELHWILSARAFALISIVASMVKFYLALIRHSSLDTGSKSDQHLGLTEDFAFDATRLGYLDVLVYLVEEQGLMMSEVKNNDGLSLLFYAITCSQLEIIKYILKADKNMDMKEMSRSGNSLLHAAVNRGDPNIVKELLEANANVNQMNMECEGVMPLHLAIMQDYPEIVQLLIDAGAKINLTNTENSPLQLAADLERFHILDIIKKHISKDT